ncbi:hypothetical protein MBOE_47570 [Mycolicibacterium boenickei]|uniref:HNH nuclease domain-containing protein n=1 Tax=Mycolicibacterium boenickei TaxID=146017 RepID=A0ABN5ZFY1_9MYCO|nr:hypothetical protein MBOE_47570 [Mycolicibacterium boenickei]
MHGGTRCPQHPYPYGWGTSNWKKPKGWDATRARILARDNGICYLCNTPGATEVDHVRNQARGGNEDGHNLRAVHKDCHKKKTARDRHKK